MQSQLIFLIALVAGCTAVTSNVHQIPGQGIPNYWRMSIHNDLNFDKDEVLNGTVLFFNGKNFVQLKDGRFLPVQLKPIGMNGIQDKNVNKDFNARLYFPLRLGKDVVKISPMIRSVKFLPNQEFVYMSTPGNVQTFTCWEIDYDNIASTVTMNDNVYGMLFTVREVPGCL